MSPTEEQLLNTIFADGAAAEAAAIYRRYGGCGSSAATAENAAIAVTTAESAPCQ